MSMIEFPDAPSDRPPNDDSDRRYAQAFRDLEGRISDCVTMAGIGFQIIANASGLEGDAVFAVTHTFQMLKKLKEDYYAAYHGERDIEL
jgi:hypothetical protein